VEKITAGFLAAEIFKEAGMETYFNTDDLAAYLKVAEQRIRRWVMNREIPFHRIRTVIRFRLSEIEKWVDSGGICTPVAGDEASGGGLPDETEKTAEIVD
jgi:excisionase family DNA binding protein